MAFLPKDVATSPLQPILTTKASGEIYVFFIVLSFFGVLNVLKVLKVPKVLKVLKVLKVFRDLKVFVSLFQNLLSVYDVDALL